MADDRRWPALRLGFRDEAEPTPEQAGLLQATLDDFAPQALDTSRDHEWLVFFASRAERDAAARGLASSSLPVALRHVEALDVEDEDWAARPQQDLRAVRVEGIVVAPPWDIPAEGARQKEEGSPIIIVIEPSMGFGTGHHETTRLCLRALQSLVLAGRAVLDVGTGSGVLAIAAARLEAQAVTAIDADEDAVRAARDNISRNEVSDRVTVRHATLDDPALTPADVVVANLTGVLLRRSAQTVSRLVAPGGTLVVSGFTLDEAPLVSEAYGALSLTRQVDEDGWSALLLRN